MSNIVPLAAPSRKAAKKAPVHAVVATTKSAPLVTKEAIAALIAKEPGLSEGTARMRLYRAASKPAVTAQPETVTSPAARKVTRRPAAPAVHVASAAPVASVPSADGASFSVTVIAFGSKKSKTIFASKADLVPAFEQLVSVI